MSDNSALCTAHARRAARGGYRGAETAIPPAMTPPAPPSSAPFFIVFNRASGHGDRDEVGPTVEATCAAAGRRCELLPVDRPGRLAETAREAVRRAREVGGIVVAAGGDGTLNSVAQAVLGSGCSFGVLPRGTFNYFARTHGIPTELDGALRVLLNEDAMPVQAGQVNGRVFLVNASLGLYPQSLEDREGWKQQFGRSRLVALGAGLRTLLRGHRSLRLTIEMAGQSRRVRTPTLFVGNNALQMEQVGLPEARAIEAGNLAGVMLRPVGRWALLALLVRGAFGQLGKADEVQSFAFRRLTVKTRLLGARHIKVATDGEVMRMPLPLTFEVARQPLMLIRPAGPPPERQAAPALSAEGAP